MDGFKVRAYQRADTLWGVCDDGQRLIEVFGQEGQPVKHRIQMSDRGSEALEKSRVEAGFSFIGERWLQDGLLVESMPGSLVIKSDEFSVKFADPTAMSGAVQMLADTGVFDAKDGRVACDLYPDWEMCLQPVVSAGAISGSRAPSVLAAWLLAGLEGVLVTDTQDSEVKRIALAAELQEATHRFERSTLLELGVVKRALWEIMNRERVTFPSMEGVP